MNFFENQDAARRKTSWLIFLYLVAVVLIIFSVYLAVIGAALITQGLRSDDYTETPQIASLLWNENHFLIISAVTLIIVLLGTLYKLIAISRGGAAIAQMLGGRIVPPNTSDPLERRVLNVVEEMAIASGTPVPPLYLLEDEKGINAFAAGFSPGDAVIAVTRGCVNLLNRDELQGVIAHEFSHILNGDMRLNIRLMAVLHGILVIALIGYTLLRVSTRTVYRSYARDRGGDPRGFLIVLGILLIIIGAVGVFFGRLIKSAVSRQREFLADASAVQFTRNPLGIAGALKKIGGFLAGSRLETPRAEEASHMYFADGLRHSFFALMATHPPLAERIKLLDPSFDGAFAEVGQGAAEASLSEALGAENQNLSPFAASAGATLSATPQSVVAGVGAPSAEHLGYAAQILQAMPPALREKTREPYGARAIIYALLIDSEQEIENKQLDYLSKNTEPTIFQETLRTLPEIRALSAETCLPLVDLALPALKHLSQQQYTEFANAVEALINADNRCTLFEYTLRRIINRHLDPTLRQSTTARVKFKTIDQVLEQVVLVLSTLAHAGAPAPEEAAHAFAQGITEIRSTQTCSILPPQQCTLRSVDQALQDLLFAAPAIKQQLIAACSACVISDGQITVEEAELLRATADALDCPIPPFLH